MTPGTLRSRMLPAGGMRLRVWVGEAPPEVPAIVFVHGVVASSRYMLPTARLLATRYRVYVPDLPGYGRSDKPTTHLTTRLLAEGLTAFIRDNAIGPATLLGNSYGCQIAAPVAVAHPEFVERLIFVGPTIDRHARTLVRQALRLALDVPVERLSLPLVLTGDIIDLGIPRAIAVLRAMIEDRPEDLFPLLDLPVLVVRGERDTVVPPRWANEVVTSLPHGRLAIIPGGPHAANYSRPVELARLTEEFIESTPPRVTSEIPASSE